MNKCVMDKNKKIIYKVTWISILKKSNIKNRITIMLWMKREYNNII